MNPLVKKVLSVNIFEILLWPLMLLIVGFWVCIAYIVEGPDDPSLRLLFNGLKFIAVLAAIIAYALLKH